MPTFSDVLRARLSRRRVLTGGLSAAGLGWLGPAAWAGSPLGFTGVPVSSADTLVVPPGYVAEVLYAWGDPISDGPAFKPDASNSVDDQLRQAGMHHDGMRFFPLPAGRTGSTHGVLAINHEYTDDGLLHPDGMLTWSAEKVRAGGARGPVIEVRLEGNRWRVVRPSRYARRVTAATPMGITGPAAGHAWMRTAADPAGRTALGTMSNCAMGYTPWGTYLTCEENFQFYFVNRSGSVPPLQQRYGITARGGGYRWHEFDERFDAARHPNEPSRFGWVVEIDPFDPSRPPLKRTALGRFKHEGAALSVAPDRRVAFYMADDERFEHVYKFVSRDPANRDALDHGTLYAARFDADGTGVWLELAAGRNGLDAGTGFSTQAEICIEARRAGDVAGRRMGARSGSRHP
jgi:secreted PhoX family phosphatase